MGKPENMEISYHREMKKNYLMISGDEFREQAFETRMLVGNTIDGLLKLRIRKTDDHCQFCYEITSRQPLGRLLETKSINEEQIRALLLGIAQTLERMEEYLLTEEQILLTPDFIYVEPERFSPELCLIPGRTGDFPKEFSAFLQFLLDKVDHQDKDAVVLVYGMYRESLKENYGLENLLRYLTKESCPNVEYGKEERTFEKIENETFWDVREDHRAVSGSERLPEGEPKIRRKQNQRQDAPFPGGKIVGWGMLLPVLFGGAWAWKGDAGIGRLLTQGAMLVAGSGVISLVGIAVTVWRWNCSRKETADKPVQQEYREERKQKTAHQQKEKRRKTVGETDENGSQDQEKRNSWQMIFCEEEEPELQKREESDTGEDTHTVLLWSREQPDSVRRLLGEDGKAGVIEILYYPFLIGKQENLTDYVLSSDTVSRVHARIDRTENRYSLTDLNSTNGTFINGRRLETNESVELNIGDRIGIAEFVFQFQ